MYCFVNLKELKCYECIKHGLKSPKTARQGDDEQKKGCVAAISLPFPYQIEIDGNKPKLQCIYAPGCTCMFCLIYSTSVDFLSSETQVHFITFFK